jgi:hypothetical protein
MEGWVWVTGSTLLWRPLKNIVNMAFGTLEVHMRTSQLKSVKAVVEGGIRPIRWVVTELPGSTKRAIMLVILLMARVTILEPTLESVDVAAFTGYINVLALELEISQVMVKLRPFPAIGTVTHPTVPMKVVVSPARRVTLKATDFN